MADQYSYPFPAYDLPYGALTADFSVKYNPYQSGFRYNKTQNRWEVGWGGLFSVLETTTSLTPNIFRTPNSGDTIVVPVGTDRLVIEGSGVLATLTVDLSSLNPKDNQSFKISTKRQITALTINGETFLLNSNSGAAWFYRGSNNTWYPDY